MQTKNISQNASGFTLIEIMLVLAIMAIIFAGVGQAGIFRQRASISVDQWASQVLTLIDQYKLESFLGKKYQWERVGGILMTIQAEAFWPNTMEVEYLDLARDTSLGAESLKLDLTGPEFFSIQNIWGCDTDGNNTDLAPLTIFFSEETILFPEVGSSPFRFHDAVRVVMKMRYGSYEEDTRYLFFDRRSGVGYIEHVKNLPTDFETDSNMCQDF